MNKENYKEWEDLSEEEREIEYEKTGVFKWSLVIIFIAVMYFLITY